MDSSFSVSPRRGYDLPKPETGLAEWTSKIKALQRQVDEDEEDEQKRLEEEIAAARQARLRRSRGMGGGSRADSLDLSNSKEQLGHLGNIDDASSKDSAKSLSERQNEQDSALRKLMGRNEVHNPDKVGMPNSSNKDPVSLAAFMGGHATGPRLNRHAPQQDAHDPTQFIQPNISAPHPVFGRGGVAMPGMGSKKDSKSPGPIVGSESFERYQPSTGTPKSTPMKQEGSDTSRADKLDIHRRSFTGTPKSPSPSLAARYTEKIDSQNTRDTKPSTTPLLNTRRSFGAIPKTTSPLPSPSFVKPEQTTPPDAAALSLKPNNSFNSVASSTASLPAPSFTKKDEAAPSDTYTPSKSFTSVSQSPVPAPSIPKEEVVQRDTNAYPTKSTDSYRPAFGSNPAAAKSTPLFTSMATPSFTSSSPRSGVASPSSTGSTSLRQLMERNKVYNPDKEPERKSVAERAQTTSLAAFMGAPGKGIRLNKHAPQQDAHDPTQFIQPDLSAPHPIFGRGGVAMPGMALKKSHSAQESPTVDTSEVYRPSTTKKPTWPPVSTTPKVEERPVSPQKTGNRERTISAPRPTSGPSFNSPHSSGGWASSRSARAASPTKESYTTPTRDRTISGPAPTPSYLARPIQPEPKASSLSPQIPLTVASPAFQKPVAQKDLTPSLSRLQGRGFVQNVVKASSHLEATPPSPTPGSSDRSRPPSASGKKGSVLDRWQPSAQTSSPTKLSPSPSYTNVMKRSSIYDPVTKAGPSPQLTGSSASSGGASHGLKSVASLPSLAKSSPSTTSIYRNEIPDDPHPRSRTPGLGSATTMVVIKPSKSFTDLKQLTHVDEHGIKQETGQNKYTRTTQPDPSSRKPLIHPTKDRARKPKKNHDDHTSTDDESPALSQIPFQDKPLTVFEVAQGIALPTSPLPVDSSALEFPKASPLPSPEPKVDDKENEVGLSNVVISTKTPPSDDFGANAADLFSPVVPPSPDASHSLVKERTTASSPAKHSRIPSTGNRPTVMEVAQALSDLPDSDIQMESPTAAFAVQEPPSPVEPVARPRSAISSIQAEKRRSTYERYSAIILPPLKEEATPTPSPAGTLRRTHEPLTDKILNGIYELEESHESDVGVVEEDISVDDAEGVVNLHLRDEPIIALNEVKVAEMLKARPRTPQQQPDILTISVEVLSIVANSATAVNRSCDIFYDTEILAVIHRTKSKSSGLASTTVWCWLGKQTRLGDREEKKLNELAKRYGTTARIVQQLAEPPELVQIFGGRLAIRQGTRAHWTSENTTMHLVRNLNGVTYIDEYDFSIKNLCSAFSYCFTMLGSFYVWHGCGSTTAERQAALEYVQTLSLDPVSSIELVEGEDDDDEMFWMILGDEEFAKADYWRWRKESSETDALIWRIEKTNVNKAFVPVEFISMEQDLQNSVYVVHCIWELFVIVGKEARGDRQAIRCAVDIAKKLSSETASARPYSPNVHILVLPSQLPLDLRLGIRDLDEAWLNNGEIPDHMNLLHYSEAVDHLGKHSWERAALKDLDFLPLGVNIADVP